LKVNSEDIMSLVDVAHFLGIQPNNASMWRKRYKDFPKPFMVVANNNTPLFLKSDIIAWYKSRISPELLEKLQNE